MPVRPPARAGMRRSGGTGLEEQRLLTGCLPSGWRKECPGGRKATAKRRDYVKIPTQGKGAGLI